MQCAPQEGPMEEPALTLAAEERRGEMPWALRLAVVIVILGSAAALYAQFLPVARFLWYSAEHDRSGHYARSFNVAVALRHASIGGLIREIHEATVWPPLHPLVTGAVLALTGLDYRFAVLSSLGCWAVTCWFVFALATRLVPRYRWFAGCVALLLRACQPRPPRLRDRHHDREPGGGPDSRRALLLRDRASGACRNLAGAACLPCSSWRCS